MFFPLRITHIWRWCCCWKVFWGKTTMTQVFFCHNQQSSGEVPASAGMAAPSSIDLGSESVRWFSPSIRRCNAKFMVVMWHNKGFILWVVTDNTYPICWALTKSQSSTTQTLSAQNSLRVTHTHTPDPDAPTY